MPTEPPYRCPTRAAIDSLARRFDLPNTPEMQDWEYQVASAERLSEFLSVFETGQLDDDERFTLMETIIESFLEFESESKWRDTWPRIEAHLRCDFELHTHNLVLGSLRNATFELLGGRCANESDIQVALNGHAGRSDTQPQTVGAEFLASKKDSGDLDAIWFADTPGLLDASSRPVIWHCSGVPGARSKRTS